MTNHPLPVALWFADFCRLYSSEQYYLLQLIRGRKSMTPELCRAIAAYHTAVARLYSELSTAMAAADYIAIPAYWHAERARLYPTQDARVTAEIARVSGGAS